MTLNALFLQPFCDFIFLKRAFVACCLLILGSAPVGVLLVLRRMSLMGDALSHSVMPGVALGYLWGGVSIPLMGLGGFIASLLVAFFATYVTRQTQLKEDASFVSFYLIALALGTLLISLKGNAIDLSHILFGTILGIGPSSLLMVGGATTFTLLVLAFIYRPLVIECFDSVFLQSVGGKSKEVHALFMGLVVLNMVAAFQTMGTLMALGLMLLPAITARFWSQRLTHLFFIAILIAIGSAYGGLVLSFHLNVPSGPAIILVAGFFYIISMIAGPLGSLLTQKKGV